MKNFLQMTRAELIKRVKVLETSASTVSIASGQERLLHELQVHQIELETQNRELREAQLLLEVSRDRYADLYDFAPVGYVTFNAKGIIREINLTAARMLGVERSRLVGMPFHLHVVREDLARFREHLRKLSNPEERLVIELRVARKGGGAPTVLMQSVLVPDEEKKGWLCRASLTDVTMRRQAEEALCTSEGMLNRAQGMAHVGGYEINASATCGDHWSEETFRILGLDPATRELTLTEHIRDCIHPEDRARVREAFDKARNERVRFDLEYRVVRPDASIRHVHSIVEPVMGADSQTVKLVGTLQDITERKELEKEILAISEREQSRIGQDLHDGLCQHLAGIEFRLMSLKQKLDAKSSKQAVEMAELAKLVRQGIEQTRTLARGLSPVMLEPGGLMSALQELATYTVKSFNIACSLNCPRPILMHNNAAATHLYRIAQEAIQNAIRHGKAKFIAINLFAQQDRIVLGVKDDGVGFPKKPRKHNGMGLRVMQYRAAMVGGSLLVQHEPGGGTSVVCSLHAHGSGQEAARPANKGKHEQTLPRTAVPGRFG